MFNFTPLLGAQSPTAASQSLLELDGGVKVLIDVGWDEQFTASELKALERHIPSLSIILLTHPTTSHLGAFAHYCKNFPLFTQIPIYATTPVISLGRTLLQDIYSSTPLASTVIPPESLVESSYASGSSPTDPTLQLLQQPPTAEEIAHYFSLIHPLKYSQPHEPLPSAFSPPLNGLKITAYNAGHTLGGTIWHLQHGMESIVHAVDWNQVRENVLGGAAWLDASGGGAEVIEQLRKPTALVCSSRGAEKLSLTGGRKKRDDLLLDTIRATLVKGGTVLIPTDTSARVLELAYLLEHAWRKEHSNDSSDSPFQSAKLYLASKNVGATMRYARSMLEWMDENIVKELEAVEAAATTKKQHKRTDSKPIGSRENESTGRTAGPFDFQYLRLLERKKQVDKIMSRKGAKVILASDASLEWGFSKEILQKVAVDTINLIILTGSRGGRGESNINDESLGSLLWSWYQERRDGVALEPGSDGQNLEQVHTGGRELEVKHAERVALEGRELLAYQQYLATQRRLQNQIPIGHSATIETAADAVDDTSSTSSSSSEESDPERQGKALNTSAAVANLNRNKGGLNKETLGVNILLRQPGVYDYDVRGKKGREQMFPFVSKRRRADDFGDLIRPDEYLRAEERDDIDGRDMRDGATSKDNKFGQKRKWGDAGLQGENGYPRSSMKRHQQSNSADRNGLVNGNVAINGHRDPDIDEISESSGSDADEAANGPSKVVIRTQSIEAHLKIAYVDFAGLHDQRSLSMLIPLIQPRKLILVGGSASETEYLASECRQKLVSASSEDLESISNNVFTPVNGQMVNASVDTNAWTVKLSSALVKRLRWQNVHGLGVVTLIGHLAAMEVDEPQAPDSFSKKRQKLLKEDKDDSDIPSNSTESKKRHLAPVLDILPASMAAATRSVAQPLHVGDLRLADLRKILQSAGHTAEFRGEGTLLIDGLVAVRKTATGKLEVEGGGLGLPDYPARDLDASFYAVKRKIYDGLAVVAGVSVTLNGHKSSTVTKSSQSFRLVDQGCHKKNEPMAQSTEEHKYSVVPGPYFSYITILVTDILQKGRPRYYLIQKQNAEHDLLILLFAIFTPAPSAASYPPPYCMHQHTTQLDPRMWPPHQAFMPDHPPTQPPIYMQHFPFHAQLLSPPPPLQPTAPSPAQWAPPGANLLGQPAPNFEGVGYLYPRHHTVLHVILDKFMQLDTTTRLPKYEPRMFPTDLGVRELIKQLGAPDEEEERYGVVEMHELGDGRWAAGQTILLGSEYANKTLREIGWAETRGFATKPVWLKIHKVE
ncbi:MAG: hypothetical protein LQ343_006737 [Gyalolechia ehrenbergii]|nr:MAG: hypothetical protein LQ343_006737 [Gyalolechia ehrenbergii]